MQNRCNIRKKERKINARWELDYVDFAFNATGLMQCPIVDKLKMARGAFQYINMEEGIEEWTEDDLKELV